MFYLGTTSVPDPGRDLTPLFARSINKLVRQGWYTRRLPLATRKRKRIIPA